MNDLSKVEVSQFKETMSSLEISQITGKEHKNVMRDINDLLLQGVDKLNFELTSYIDKSNRTQKMFILTKKGCFILASGYNAVLREKIIDRWEELEIKNNSNSSSFTIPQTFSQALMLAAKQAEQIEEQNKLIEVKDTQILELKPKATYYDTILSSKKAECISVFSKSDYGMSGMAMNKLLHDWGIQYKVGKTWLPYQKYASLGYTKTETVSVNNGEDTATHTKWTQQGRLFIYEQMKKHGYLPLIEK